MTSPTGLQVIGLGESLFDVFDDQTVLGGAPLNVALCAHQCLAEAGGSGIVASRVGRDSLGRRLIRELAERGLDTDYVQIDSDRPTGKVLVALVDGQPQYEILKPAAWDAMQFDRRWGALAANCNAVCFGTLAQRSAVSREAIDRFLLNTTSALKLFDVNLRQNFYSSSLIENGLERATALKLNADEIIRVGSLLGMESGDADTACSLLLKKYNLRFVALTLGAEGLRLYTPGAVNAAEPVHYPTARDADAVGAGDAASAGLMIGFLLGWNVSQTLTVANHLGAYVASVPGATPQLPNPILKMID